MFVCLVCTSHVFFRNVQIVPDMVVTVDIEEPSEIKDLEVSEVQIMTNNALQDGLQCKYLSVCQVSTSAFTTLQYPV